MTAEEIQEYLDTPNNVMYVTDGDYSFYILLDGLQMPVPCYMISYDTETESFDFREEFKHLIKKCKPLV